jgi:hypothetical protein
MKVTLLIAPVAKRLLPRNPMFRSYVPCTCLLCAPQVTACTDELRNAPAQATTPATRQYAAIPSPWHRAPARAVLRRCHRPTVSRLLRQPERVDHTPVRHGVIRKAAPWGDPTPAVACSSPWNRVSRGQAARCVAYRRVGTRTHQPLTKQGVSWVRSRSGCRT